MSYAIITLLFVAVVVVSGRTTTPPLPAPEKCARDYASAVACMREKANAIAGDAEFDERQARACVKREIRTCERSIGKGKFGLSQLSELQHALKACERTTLPDTLLALERCVQQRYASAKLPFLMTTSDHVGFKLWQLADLYAPVVAKCPAAANCFPKDAKKQMCTERRRCFFDVGQSCSAMIGELVATACDCVHSPATRAALDTSMDTCLARHGARPQTLAGQLEIGIANRKSLKMLKNRLCENTHTLLETEDEKLC